MKEKSIMQTNGNTITKFREFLNKAIFLLFYCKGTQIDFTYNFFYQFVFNLHFVFFNDYFVENFFSPYFIIDSSKAIDFDCHIDICIW